MFIHPTAEVEAGAEIGTGTKVWHLCHIRRGARLGEGCVIGRGVFVDAGVSVGHRVKIQNYVSVFHGVTIEDGVFVGPHVCFTNDLLPRAVNPDLSAKGADDWTVSETRVKEGASIGANSTIRCLSASWAMSATVWPGSACASAAPSPMPACTLSTTIHSAAPRAVDTKGLPWMTHWRFSASVSG